MLSSQNDSKIDAAHRTESSGFFVAVGLSDVDSHLPHDSHEKKHLFQDVGPSRGNLSMPLYTYGFGLKRQQCQKTPSDCQIGCTPFGLMDWKSGVVGSLPTGSDLSTRAR